MIVPRFWAEGRAKHREKRKQVTIRRYGWSDLSQADAQANADARADDALARVLAGEKLHPRDHKVPYNGAEGLPIREEILSTHGEAVITRNSYGAHCLNTPSVLFADVDLPEPKFRTSRFTLLCFAALASLAIQAARNWGAGYLYQSDRNQLLLETIGGAIIVYILLVAIVEKALKKRHRVRLAEREKAALDRIRKYSSQHAGWALRVYRTPAGFRLLASHATFAPGQREVAECFASLGVDPVYVRMCQNQQCFRARLTAKPWRTGLKAKFRPRPGVWPIKPDQLPSRAAWVAEYERAAIGYAACRYLETIGKGMTHPDVRAVIELHDSFSRAHTELPLA